MTEITTGEQLLLIRRRNKLTQQEIADLLEWDRQKYSRVERSEDLGKLLKHNEYITLNRVISQFLIK